MPTTLFGLTKWAEALPHQEDIPSTIVQELGKLYLSKHNRFNPFHTRHELARLFKNYDGTPGNRLAIYEHISGKKTQSLSTMEPAELAAQKAFPNLWFLATVVAELGTAKATSSFVQAIAACFTAKFPQLKCLPQKVVKLCYPKEIMTRVGMVTTYEAYSAAELAQQMKDMLLSLCPAIKKIREAQLAQQLPQAIPETTLDTPEAVIAQVLPGRPETLTDVMIRSIGQHYLNEYKAPTTWRQQVHNLGHSRHTEARSLQEYKPDDANQNYIQHWEHLIGVMKGLESSKTRGRLCMIIVSMFNRAFNARISRFDLTFVDAHVRASGEVNTSAMAAVLTICLDHYKASLEQNKHRAGARRRPQQMAQ